MRFSLKRVKLASPFLFQSSWENRGLSTSYLNNIPLLATSATTQIAPSRPIHIYRSLPAALGRDSTLTTDYIDLPIRLVILCKLAFRSLSYCSATSG